MRRLSRYVWLLVPLATLTIFAPVVGHGFVYWDDHRMIFQNPHFHPTTWGTLLSFWPEEYYGLYTPLSYSVQWAIAAAAGADRAWPYHAASVLAHAGAATLVYVLLRLLRFGSPASVLGAVGFAVHPLQAEPVNWASSFYTTLSGCLGVGALAMYVKYCSAEARRGLLGIVASVLYVAALLAKPSLVIVPAMALVLEVLFIQWPRRRTLGVIGLWFVLAVPISMITVRVQEGQYKAVVPLWERPLVVMDSVAFYLGKVVAPWPLAIDYGRSPEYLRLTGQCFFTWVVPVALIVAGVILARRWGRAWLAFPLLFPVGALPFLGLLTFGFQRYSTTADRYAYLSLVALSILIAQVVSRARMAVYVVAPVLVAWAGLSVAQSAVWRDTPSLMTHALAVNPASSVAHNVLAYVATEDHDEATAAYHYGETLRHHPDDWLASYQLGNLRLRAGDFAGAVACYRNALVEKPADPAIWLNLGSAYVGADDATRAERALRRAVELDPNWAAAQANLGLLLASQGRVADGRRALGEALRIDPTYGPALRGLSRLETSTRPGP